MHRNYAAFAQDPWQSAKCRGERDSGIGERSVGKPSRSFRKRALKRPAKPRAPERIANQQAIARADGAHRRRMLMRDDVGHVRHAPARDLQVDGDQCLFAADEKSRMVTAGLEESLATEY